jgi:hypothetical protein
VTEPAPDYRRDVMPRVRIGLTGLACVFLLVLIAAALFGNQRGVRRSVPEEPLAELGVAPGGAPPAKPTAATSPITTRKPIPREPLAELGVAPGGPDRGPTATQPTRKAAAGVSQTGPGVAH